MSPFAREPAGLCTCLRALETATLWLCLLVELFGCAGRALGGPRDVAPAPSPKPVFEGAPLSDDPDVYALLASHSSNTEYHVDALGARGGSVSLSLANRGTRPVQVDHLRIELTATRSGVSFPCKSQVGPPQGYHEPRELGPGQSFLFERSIECEMPLPGRYDIAVYGAVNDAGGRGSLIGQFALDVAPSAAAPRPYPSRPGLYVAMVGEHSTRPLSPEAWARGDYHVVLAVVNGSNQPARVDSARLGLLTYRKGSPLPCSGQAEPIRLPVELLPGSTSIVRLPLSCAPSEEGQYEIVGRVVFGGAEEIEVGRVSLRVTRAPILFDPDPGLSGNWGGMRNVVP